MPQARAVDVNQVAAIGRDYVELLGQKQLQRALALWEPGSIDHLVGIGDLRAPDEVAPLFEDMYAAVPDLHLEIQSVTAQDDRAVVLWRVSGTFDGTGTYLGVRPNGTTFDVEGVDILTITDGRIVYNTSIMNGLDFARQIGLMPRQNSPAERAMYKIANLAAPVAKAVRRRRRR
jgi:steroid delta-isomerase-like uncharacterized protein